ncbi:MAG: DUF6036 family nucleotidyltransferase [Candidatus Eremiobacterota bacterium]
MEKKYEVLLKKVREINSNIKRQLFFLAIMTDALEGIKPVIVGGVALEFYSTGGYSTGDIDIIYPDVKVIGEKLQEWGFQKKGRHWINEELDIFIEIPGSYLSEDEKKRITLVEIENLSVYLIGVEDLIIDRLNAFVHWQSTDDGYWAKELLFIYKEKLDMEYLKKRCSEEQTSEELEKLLREVKEIEKN